MIFRVKLALTTRAKLTLAKLTFATLPPFFRIVVPTIQGGFLRGKLPGLSFRRFLLYPEPQPQVTERRLLPLHLPKLPLIPILEVASFQSDARSPNLPKRRTRPFPLLTSTTLHSSQVTCALLTCISDKGGGYDSVVPFSPEGLPSPRLGICPKSHGKTTSKNRERDGLLRRSTLFRRLNSFLSCFRCKLPTRASPNSTFYSEKEKQQNQPDKSNFILNRVSHIFRAFKPKMPYFSARPTFFRIEFPLFPISTIFLFNKIFKRGL